MDIKELLSRKSPSIYTIEEACFIVEKYIFQEKGKIVKINIFKNVDMQNINDPISTMILTEQLQMLNYAFIQASQKLKI